jgi:hypothetical protein
MFPLGRLVEFYEQEGFRFVQEYTERDPYIVVEFELGDTIVHHSAFPHPYGGVHVSSVHVVDDAERQGVNPEVIERLKELFHTQENEESAE